MATKNRHKPIAMPAAPAAPWDAGADIDDVPANDLDELLADVPEAAAEAAPQPPPTTEIRKLPAPKLRKVRIEAQLAPLFEQAYRPTHVEARLDPAQARVLRRLLDGLDQAGARLRNGRRVGSPADSVRWLLEQLDEGGS